MHMPDRREKKRRSLSRALLGRTLTIALILGLLASAITMWGDLQREKDAVENLARDFLASAGPSAAAAAYNYDQVAAEQVAEGLFLERAITRIVILNEGDVMVDEQRRVEPTLPQIGIIGSVDEVTLTRTLFEPSTKSDPQAIGELTIVVDKSLVAPEIVDRLFSYFAISTAKNVLLGLLLYWMVFSILAKHITALALTMRAWEPRDGPANVPIVPNFLRTTEVDSLGHRIESLTASASRALNSMQKSHDTVLDTNAELNDEVRDRTKKLEHANARLQRMAERDGLTGLFNRAYFDRLLADYFSRAQNSKDPVAVILVDVDHFKPFNDFYGHQAGDATLVQLASILKDIQAETGCIMARYGGEEFVGLMQSSAKASKKVAEKIQSAVEQAAIEHQHSTVARQITVSIGTASTAEEGMFATADALVSAADDALYEAKSDGRNRTVVSTPDIRDRALAQRMSVQAILQAIGKKEFEPYIQPQVDARTGELVGAEALVRWVRSNGEVVAPGEFMQTAESTGLIKKIDTIVLEKITSFLRSHPQTLPKLSFNVTGNGFNDREYVTKIIELSKSVPTNITVELLETAFIDRPDDHFLWQLDLLREAGVSIEIDDFGTGRTSILGLMAINPSRLKIARELITPLGHRLEQKNVVTSVIEIARSLNMNVIAEGVESEETSRILIEIGCPIQQGYLHSKPVQIDEFLESQVGDRRRLTS